MAKSALRPRARGAHPLLAVLMAAIIATPAAAQPVCAKGELFAGTPNYGEPADRPSDGHKLISEPPLGWRAMVFVDDKLVTSVGDEIWYTELATPSPVMKRMAGRNVSKGRFSNGGPCNAARFTIVHGLAARSDGSLVGADAEANNLFAIKDPFGPACSVTMIAGATLPQTVVDGSRPPNAGDQDGPGPKALLSNPDWVAVTGDTTYFIDGSRKVKRIDAADSVKTVAALPEGRYYALTTLKGRLYAVANNQLAEGFIVEIDPVNGAVREVLRGRSDVWLGRGAIYLSGLATDGEGLFTSHSGKRLYVTLDGNVSHLAGNGVYVDFQSGYDSAKPHDALDLQLVSLDRRQTAGANVFLTYHAGAVYYGARNLTPYVVRIACK
jgi:hypothetical protein